MSSVNVLAKEIAAKLVFYGPGLSGKTTSLKKVYESVRPSNRGELMSLPTESDRTLFFDFLPVKVERVGEYSVRLALYTVPGQVFYNATRKLVLQGADGVVFVADSQREAEDANRESMHNLEENLSEQGVDLARFPLVFQYNKRDLATAMPVAELRRILNPRGVPDFETCATSGQGVLDALKASIRLIIRDLRARKVVPALRPRVEPEHHLAAEATGPSLAGQIHEALERHDAQQPARVPVHPPMATPSRPVPTVIAPLPPPPPPTDSTLGPAAALAPSQLLDHARAADAAYATHDWDGCVRACSEGLHRGLAYAGEGSFGGQAYLLRVDGGDVLRLESLATRTQLRVDDAAFALSVLCQLFNRLSEAGLPPRAD